MALMRTVELTKEKRLHMPSKVKENVFNSMALYEFEMVLIWLHPVSRRSNALTYEAIADKHHQVLQFFYKFINFCLHCRPSSHCYINLSHFLFVSEGRQISPLTPPNSSLPTLPPVHFPPTGVFEDNRHPHH